MMDCKNIIRCWIGYLKEKQNSQKWNVKLKMWKALLISEDLLQLVRLHHGISIINPINPNQIKSNETNSIQLNSIQNSDLQLLSNRLEDIQVGENIMKIPAHFFMTENMAKDSLIGKKILGKVWKCIQTPMKLGSLNRLTNSTNRVSNYEANILFSRLTCLKKNTTPHPNG